MRARRSRLAALGVVVALAPAAASTGGATAAPTAPTTPAATTSTTVGAVFVPAQESMCSDVTVLQSSSPGGSYAIPDDGVVTAWQFQGGAQLPSLVELRIGRRSGDGYTIIAAPLPATESPGGLFTQGVRIPVETGDLLGLYLGPGDAPDCARQVDGYAVVGVDGRQPVGPFASETQARVQLSVSATLEPDADGDGFGDVTQDQCASEPDEQGQCRLPDTTIKPAKIGRPKAGSGKAPVSVRFTSSLAGSTYRCALDNKRFRPCTSPLRATLAPGRHKLSVRAVAPGGATDPTPATSKVRVKKK